MSYSRARAGDNLGVHNHTTSEIDGLYILSYWKYKGLLTNPTIIFNFRLTAIKSGNNVIQTKPFISISIQIQIVFTGIGFYILRTRHQII